MTGGRRSFVASVEPVTDFVVWTVCLLRSGGWNSASRRSASPFFVGVFYRPGAVLWPSSSVACVPRRLVSRARASPVLSLRGHRPRLPLLASPVARVRWCACPCPPTQYTLPPDTLSHRRTGAAGTALHMDSLGSARPTSLLPLRRVARRRYTHSLARTLAHSGTAPSGQASTHHTFVEGRRGATPAQLVYCSTYCRGSARASQAHIVSLSAPPSHSVHPSRPSCSAAGGGGARGATSSACGRPWACAPFPCAAVPSVACRRWAAAPSCPRSTTHSGRRLVRVGVSAVCSHCFFPRPFLPWALSPGGHPRRVHGPCLVSFRVVVGVVRLCCSCVFSRHAMLVVPPVSSRRHRHALPPVPVSCCPTVPWCRAAPAVAAARRCRPWPQRPPAKFRRGVYRGSRAPWLCALAAGLIDSWSRPVMEFL